MDGDTSEREHDVETLRTIASDNIHLENYS